MLYSLPSLICPPACTGLAVDKDGEYVTTAQLPPSMMFYAQSLRIIRKILTGLRPYCP
jgi:hypothetical protein